MQGAWLARSGERDSALACEFEPQAGHGARSRPHARDPATPALEVLW